MSSSRKWILLLFALPMAAVDTSPPVILQWFESSYRTMERRMADVFMAGYGFVWVPPPGRADISNFSVGYDVYDRFDLGQPGKPTLYGTENGLKALARTIHRAGLSLHADFVMNHAGFSTLDTPGFVKAGGYPGLAITLPNDIDGDFHSAFDFSEQGERLKGLVDIGHEKNHRFIRNPIATDARNIPAGTVPAFGRLANVPDAANRRFYPEEGHQTIHLFDPIRNEQNIPRHSFNLEHPERGMPVAENALGYLMRNAQWLVQVIGVDGLRIDAAKHMTRDALQSLDRAVYRTNPRRLLDGTQSHVFCYSEMYDGNPKNLLPHVRKDINPADIGKIGGNRDALDFNLYFVMKENLEQTGVPNAWSRIRRAGLDLADDRLRNGSAGVTFTHNHDVFRPFALENVAQAFTLMMPGNTAVYFNGKEFGDNRDFPLAGRGDALSVGKGSLLTRLLEARHTHGRGDYAERCDGSDGLFAFERQGAALVLLSNRGDAGFDSRTLTNVSFRPGTLLVELSGNAEDPTVNPNRDIPQVLRVFAEGGVSKVNVRFARPATVNRQGQTIRHGRGLLVYGLPLPESANGIELTNVTSTLPGAAAPANDRENGLGRQTPIDVIRADRFEVVLRTRQVKLLGSNDLRDVDADGDQALLRLDAGVDLNGDGKVDFIKAGSLEYGFERFRTKHSPLIGGTGEFRQQIDASRLSEGMHFLTVRVYRRQPADKPPVFRDFRKVFLIDRRPPEVTATVQNGEIRIQCDDDSAESLVALRDLPAGLSDEEIFARPGIAGVRIDHGLFRIPLPAGAQQLTLVIREETGRKGIRRVTIP